VPGAPAGLHKQRLFRFSPGAWDRAACSVSQSAWTLYLPSVCSTGGGLVGPVWLLCIVYVFLQDGRMKCPDSLTTWSPAGCPAGRSGALAAGRGAGRGGTRQRRRAAAAPRGRAPAAARHAGAAGGRREHERCRRGGAPRASKPAPSGATHSAPGCAHASVCAGLP